MFGTNNTGLRPLGIGLKLTHIALRVAKSTRSLMCYNISGLLSTYTFLPFCVLRSRCFVIDGFAAPLHTSFVVASEIGSFLVQVQWEPRVVFVMLRSYCIMATTACWIRWWKLCIYACMVLNRGPSSLHDNE